MARPYSEAFKRKMVERLIGKDAISAVQLSKESGERPQNFQKSGYPEEEDNDTDKEHGR